MDHGVVEQASCEGPADLAVALAAVERLLGGVDGRGQPGDGTGSVIGLEAARRHRAHHEPVENARVRPEQGVRRFLGDELVEIAAADLDGMPAHQGAEGVDECDPVPVTLGLEVAAIGDRLGEQTHGRHRSGHQFGGDQAEELVALAVKGGVLAPSGGQRPRRVGVSTLLGEPGDARCEVDGEHPPARLVEPGGQPRLVPSHQAEGVQIIIHVAQRSGQQGLDRVSAFDPEACPEHARLSHDR